MMKSIILIFFIILLKGNTVCFAQKQQTEISEDVSVEKTNNKPVVKYGIASYYANKFHDKPTATGEVHKNEILSAACNVLPLNTWVRVTNMVNNKSVVVKINDRMAKNNKRLIDLSRSAAQELGYIARGLTKVKVEVLSDFRLGKGLKKN